MSLTVAILQSNYLPWKGYFDIIHDVDLFVFYDDVQFTKNDWRNRNRLKAPGGANWLTIPVGQSLDRLICEVQLPDDRWAKKHWRTITQLYGRAPHFSRYRDIFENIFLRKKFSTLSALNQCLIRTIAVDCLGMTTRFADSRDFRPEGRKSDRLIDLLVKTGATKYISGPAARNYLSEGSLQQAGIELVYKSYDGYPEYPQFHPPFDHYVSIIDLLFQAGDKASSLIWGWRAHEKLMSSEFAASGDLNRTEPPA